MNYQIIDTPNDPEINDLITLSPISSSKVLKILHGESTSYLSIESLDLMNKTNKLINPLTNLEYPPNIKNLILDTIKNCDGELFCEKLTDIINKIKQNHTALDYQIENNRGYKHYENFIEYKLELIETLNKIEKLENKEKANVNLLQPDIEELKNQLVSLEDKLIHFRENLFYRIMLVDFFMARSLNMEIPWVTELNIPDYIFDDSRTKRIIKLTINLSNDKNKLKKKHHVLIKNLSELVNMVSYDYLNHKLVWLENIKWNGYIDVSKLSYGIFKFYMYSPDQKIIYPSNIGHLELKLCCDFYELDLFYINHVYTIELEGDFLIKSLPQKVNDLIWILDKQSINYAKEFIELINNKKFRFNKIIFKSYNIEKLNEMLMYLNPEYYYIESNVFTMGNLETGEEIHLYNVHIYNKMSTLNDYLLYFF